VKGPKADTVPFHPYYTVKDGFAHGRLFLMFFAWFVFFQPNYLGHADNYIPADPLVTPRTSFRNGTSCRSTRSCVIILFFLPWLDSSKVRSGNYRPMFKWFFWLFVLNAMMLGWLGSKPAEGIFVVFSLIGTVYYFGYFLVILPLLGKYEKTKPLPESISASISKGSH
jgi:ubiquinol-cytochrome c reductase cytochrome b/c1 subunit